MNYNYLYFLSRLPLAISKKHSRTFLQMTLKYRTPVITTFRRCFCEKPLDLYAAINEDDFEIFEQSSHYKDVNFENIAEGNPDTLKSLKFIQLEIDLYAQEGGKIPSKITSSQWLDLLSYSSRSQRQKYLNYLWINETRKLSKKLRQQKSAEEKEIFKSERKIYRSESTDSPVGYGLLQTTLFHRIYDQQMKDLYNFRLLQAMIFGPRIIIDCGYEEYMKTRDLSHCVRDLVKSWSLNRDRFDPFDLQFCNLNEKSVLFSKLCAVLPAIEGDPTCPFNYTDKHYLDLYPKDKLIYLTPYCNDDMVDYDSDCMYIIGAVTCIHGDSPLSLARAKKDGIRRVRLPLDRYLKWTFGKKTLRIQECVDILNDFKDSGNWHFALRRLAERQHGRKAINDEEMYEARMAKSNAQLEELLKMKDTYDILLTKKKNN